MWATHYGGMGGTLQKCISEIEPIKPTANFMLIGPTKGQQRDQVQMYRMKRVKLSWALIWIMSKMHNKGVQHNDLFINNIILHWELDISLMIGVCN